MSGDTEVEPNVPIQVGLDFGLTPAATIGQRLPNGRWLIHHEIVTFDMGLERFGMQLLAELNQRFPNHQVMLWGDPAGMARDAIYEVTSFDFLRTLGLKAQPTASNDFKVRREAAAMRLSLLCAALLVPVLSVPASGMAKKTPIAVRFHSEASKHDSDTFSVPVNLVYQRRQAYLSSVADISEKMIEKILPFPAKDGTWGCVLKLTPQGRLRLETMSGALRGSALVVFVTTEVSKHQVADMIIDRPVTDGIITIPRGLADFEVALLKKNFKILGETTKPNLREKPRDLPREMAGGRFEPPADRNAAYDPISSPAPKRRRGLPEPALPRVGD